MQETKGPEKEEKADPPAMAALQMFGPSGEARQQLLRGKPEARLGDVVPMPFYGPSWSPDGLIAFTGSVGRSQRIYVAAPDGSGLRAVPGTKGGADPVFSPDGHMIAFSRLRVRSHLDPRHIGRSRFYSSVTTWVTDLDGSGARRLTRWRDGLYNEPSSFSPDGSTLALTKDDENLDGPRVMLMRLDGGGTTELVGLAKEPTFSPDGSRVAFVGYKDLDVVQAEENRDYTAGELYAMNLDGTEMRRLTRSDDVLESAPSWNPSGQRIAYVRARADTSAFAVFAFLFPVGNSIMQINADGTCGRKVISLRKTAFYGVAWQPGASREAAPIAC